MILALPNRFSEDVGIETVVISELKFRDVQRHILSGHFVERANHAAIEDRPETLNRIRVNCSDNVLLAGMIDHLVVVVSQSAIDLAFVSGEQANLVGNHFTNERFGGFFRDVLQHASDHVALATDGADNRSFGREAMFARQTVLAKQVVTRSPTERDEKLDRFTDSLRKLH